MNYGRDLLIRQLRASGCTMQQVADQVGMSVSGVLRALRRLERAA
ncbi:winged helix-turn-helix domain-containing protein [Microbacterium maritypicum]